MQRGLAEQGANYPERNEISPLALGTASLLRASMEPTLATFIDFSTLAAARSRSSIFLVNDLICARPGNDLRTRATEHHNRTYLVFSALILIDDTRVCGENQLQFLLQCLQLVLQLIRGSLVRLPRL